MSGLLPDALLAYTGFSRLLQAVLANLWHYRRPSLTWHMQTVEVCLMLLHTGLVHSGKGCSAAQMLQLCNARVHLWCSSERRLKSQCRPLQ